MRRVPANALVEASAHVSVIHKRVKPEPFFTFDQTQDVQNDIGVHRGKRAIRRRVQISKPLSLPAYGHVVPAVAACLVNSTR
jgi:hypothetical protein